MLFTEITFTNNTKQLKASDFLLSRAWEMLCEKHCGKLSADAIRALLFVDFDSKLTGVTSQVASEICDPFFFANDGAVIWPDYFQCWESDDLSLCTRNGDLFSLTFVGEVMKGKLMAEIEKKYKEHLWSIESNEHIHVISF